MKDRGIKINEYRNTVNRSMIAVLALIVFMNVLILIEFGIAKALKPRLDAVTFEVVDSLMYSAVYVLMFMLPCLVYKLFSINHVYYPLPAKPVLPKCPVRITLATVGINHAFALLSSLIITFALGLMGLVPDTSLFETEINGIHSIALSFLSMAIIPALVEEFLFRGVILKNLMPYGKTVAVVISALLFGLMHQNFFQFLYAFAAGLMLGYVFLLTGSVWCGVLIHFINNFISVLDSALGFYLGEEAAAKVNHLITAVLLLLGLLSLISLIKKYSKEKPLKKGSVFGDTEELLVFESDMKVSEKEAVKHFFTPLTWVTLAVILISALTALSQTVTKMELPMA